MQPIVLTRDLSKRGIESYELGQLRRRGELVRVRRGAYTDPEPDVDDKAASPSEALSARHQQLILGTVPQLHPRAVISHGSAAVLHRLPVFPEAVRHLHVTRDRRGGGVIRSVVHVHGSPLTPEDVTVIDGIPVTSLARTVADLARTLPYRQAVAIGDRALALGLDPGDLAVAVELGLQRKGSPQARRVAAFIDGRSESVGESFSRVGFDDDGLPPPIPQFDVYDGDRFVARSDFGWPELGTLGEFDGREKYLRFRRDGETLDDFLIREKLREDALRDLGWQVVRWVWAELFRQRVIAERLGRAFERGRRQPFARVWRVGSTPE